MDIRHIARILLSVGLTLAVFGVPDVCWSHRL